MISFKLIFIVHFLAALFNRTWFVPDEHFQTVEVAYGMVYGHNEKTWEWHPDNALRSYIYPSIYAAHFEIASLLNLDSTWVIRHLPSLLNLILMITTDSAVLKWYKREVKEYKVAVILFVTNWFVTYNSNRSLANSMEMMLHCWAFMNYPRNLNYIPIALLAGLVRPTSAIVWGPLVLKELLSFDRHVIKKFVTSSVLLLGISVAIDHHFYKKLTFPPFNFFIFNVASGQSSQFGVNPWYYYLQCVFMLMPIECIIFFLSIIINLCRIQSAGISKSSLTSATFVSACLYLLVHSLIPHKEHRFFLPVIPMLIPTIVNSLPRKNVGVSSFTIGALVMVNIGVSAYLGLFHQYGHKPTMDSLHEGMKRYPQGGRIAILTPCYALPFYSYLHPEGLKWNITQLNCIDPYKEVDGKMVSANDYFFHDPIQAINQNWDYLIGQSKFIVMYTELFNKIRQAQSNAFMVLGSKYKRLSQHNHTHFPVGGNSGTQFIVLERDP